MSVQWEIETIMLVLRRFILVDAHVLCTLQACKELSHGHVKLG
jgi:hypothetical protein